MDEPLEDMILDLLETERSALLVGGFDSLPRIAPRKEELFRRLEADPSPDPASLRRIAWRIDRNQRILAAAIGGIRNAAARLDILRNVQKNLTTYDRQGQMATVAQTRPAFERKA
jgi:flagellar biosynthesis/type III secretory pathway chaperone